MSAAREGGGRPLVGLLDRVERAERGEEPPAEPGEAERDALPSPKRLLDLPPAQPLEFRVDRLLLASDVNAIVGDGEAMKTTMMLAVSGAVAAGACALGELVVQPGPVLFVSGEDPADVIRNRLAALAAGHGWDLEAMLGRYYVLDEGVDLDDVRWQLRLVEAARDVGAVLACFDPLVDLCGRGVEENSNSDAKRITKYLRAFGRATGATPWLAMHVSKPVEGKTDRKHRIRGASAWKNACRMVWWSEPGDGGAQLDPVKANRLARPKPITVRVTVVTDPEFPLMWQSAHIAMEADGGAVVQRDVIAVMRHVSVCATPPTSNEVAEGDHGISRDRARTALGIARTRGWLESKDGPRRSQLWSLTEAGIARLMLDG